MKRYGARFALDASLEGTQDGDEEDADADYDKQEEEVRYAAPRSNLGRRGGLRIWRSRYGSRFDTRGERQSLASSQWTAQQGVPTPSLVQGPLRQLRLPPPQDFPTSNHHKRLMGTLIYDVSFATR